MPRRSINNPSYQAFVGAKTLRFVKGDLEFGLNTEQTPLNGPTTPEPIGDGPVDVGQPRTVKRSKPQKGGTLPFPM